MHPLDFIWVSKTAYDQHHSGFRFLSPFLNPVSGFAQTPTMPCVVRHAALVKIMCLEMRREEFFKYGKIDVFPEPETPLTKYIFYFGTFLNCGHLSQMS